ncbi:hypothetical protein [Brevundimonas fontaquae]|uniref:Uncharacterized protein n=1 Tax=Brevundimonas fontaquae TaxID=2813778 RepID=A0ABX7LK07_9CAUL|nr:hypothetical protein [Brevundimonas fontaquae]QSF53186.1 hypothetical protein JX001_10200 [Brevundimonas fontaquae]
MRLAPHQQAIWITMWARNFSYTGVAFVMIGVLALMGARFMDHQVVIGFMVGAVLVYVGDRIIRYIPDPDQPVDK